MTGCQVMAKPASSRCNLNCRYCFYIDKPQQAIMDDATLETFIQQHIAAQPGPEVQFAWQGGEPTLCGLDFFRRVVELQQRHGAGKRIHNAFQTNGILLNDAWCVFFREQGWLVGISLDGPAALHDAYRVSRSGNPTHHKVLAAIEKLRAHQVSFNLLTVINRQNSGQPERMYRYLRALGTPYLQFLPLLEHDNPESVSDAQWGAFLSSVFDIWVREDIGRIFVQLFDSTLGVWCGYPSQICSLAVTCGHAFALEAQGDLYQCDHYVYPEYRLGNIHQTPLAELNNSEAAIAFGQRKKTTLPGDCQACPALYLCNGDCPKHRVEGKSALCAGYLAFFRHCAPHMRVMRDLIRHHRSPIELMTLLRQSQ
ncbi:anaerobic sulfatase maturase [Leclercia adecarboxylata]|uniref:anaerobic sulfatase maturase n=1 Tax=Leclercia adecarboxylata TaxID=83655 RepID=UPI0021F1FA61|nr:anaerobic sulfatase maturase [Leclercia adecarboxylata]MEB5752042.1 anaerobic sulfatase maturase [Leclercia adecarboxylata]UYM53753.1 anaerobic sulfatase maturase [Leclercia adecarboxylata]